MTQEQKDLIKCRLTCVNNALRFQSGADVHALNNSRNVCTMLLSELEHADLQFEAALAIVQRLEDYTVKFFQKKYPS